MSIKLSSQRKCKGCGLPLSKDKNNLAYTPDLSMDYCQRCFKLRNYGINTSEQKALETTDEILKGIKASERDWIFCVNDILNIDFDVINHFKNHNRIIYLFNKIDLVIDDRNRNHIYNNLLSVLKSKGINNPQIILVSTLNNFGIRKISETIDQFDWSEKIYFLGKTNSGKSSIINKLINYTDSKIKPLTISHYLNTTINVRQIKLHKHAIIDTPGYNSSHSILQNIHNLKDVNKLQVNKKIKTRSFQITENQSFIIDNLVYLSLETNKLASVVFYISSKLPILRTKTINLKRNLQNKLNQKIEINESERNTKTFELNSTNKYNLCINGLGLILIKGATKLNVNTFKNVDLNLLEKVII